MPKKGPILRHPQSFSSRASSSSIKTPFVSFINNFNKSQVKLGILRLSNWFIGLEKTSERAFFNFALDGGGGGNLSKTDWLPASTFPSSLNAIRVEISKSYCFDDSLIYKRWWESAACYRSDFTDSRTRWTFARKWLMFLRGRNNSLRWALERSRVSALQHPVIMWIRNSLLAILASSPASHKLLPFKEQQTFADDKPRRGELDSQPRNC